MPKTEDLLATLNGGKRFSKLDLSQAYQQLLLHEDSKELLTVNTLKALARSYVWWPGIDKDIEKLVVSYEICQINQAMPQKAPVHNWERTNNPWVRLHIDYAVPFLGKMFLIVIDSYSKWLEVISVKHANSLSTIKALKHCFTTHGYPQVTISDNGSAFTSDEFELFLKNSGIKHIKSAPYHPSTNGCAERAVRTFKTTMKKLTDITSMSEKLQTFLFQYRIIPQSITGKSPAELLMNRKLSNELNIIKPDADSHKVNYPINSRSFEIDEKVWVQNFNLGEKWIPGSIVAITGPVSYQVSTAVGLLRKHIDHLRKRENVDPLINYDVPIPFQNPIEKTMIDNEKDKPLPSPEQSLNQETPLDNTPLVTESRESSSNIQNPNQDSSTLNSNSNIPLVNLRPQRVRRKPKYLDELF